MVKVLLADSSVTIQKVVELVLSEKGFEIKSANSGGEALAALSSFKPDIVLADIKLPNINGYELSEKIKTESQGTPVILLAGAFEAIDEGRRSKSGADDTLTKPFESGELIGKINALLEAKTTASVSAETVLEAAEMEEEPVEVEVVEEISEEAIETALAEAEVEAEVVTEAEPVVKPVEAPAPPEAAIIEEPKAAEVIVPLKMPEPAEFIEAFKASVDEKLGPALSGISDILNSVIKEKLSVSFSVPEGIIKDAVKEKLGEAIAGSGMMEALTEAIRTTVQSALKETIEKILWEVVPETAERILKDTLGQTLKEETGSIKKQLDSVIWETVPDLAESIIRAEIEKIKVKSV